MRRPEFRYKTVNMKEDVIYLILLTFRPLAQISGVNLNVSSTIFQHVCLHASKFHIDNTFDFLEDFEE